MFFFSSLRRLLPRLPRDYVRRRRAIHRLSNIALIAVVSVAAAYFINSPSGGRGFTPTGGSFMSTAAPHPRRPLNLAERKALERYARLEITFVDLREQPKDIVQFEFLPTERRFFPFYEPPQPPVRVEKPRIDGAREQQARGEITQQELGLWATMLLMIDAYAWQGLDEEAIASALNDPSFLLIDNHQG